MPLIYLRHPRHGVKIATMDLEAQYDEQHGWERYTPGELEPDDVPAAPPVNALGRRRRKEPEYVDNRG